MTEESRIYTNARSKTKKGYDKNAKTRGDIQALAEAKHGVDRAYVLACKHGSPHHKRSWQKALAEPAQTLLEQTDHAKWQASLRVKFPWLPPIINDA